MNALDVVLALVLLGAVVGGIRLGFLTRALSWVGLGVGVLIATFVVPAALDRFGPDTGDGTLFLTGAVVLLALAGVGQLLGGLLGRRLHVSLPERLRPVDRAGGAVAGAAGIVVAAWLLLPVMADVPGVPAELARGSQATRVLDEWLPEPPDALAMIDGYLRYSRFPEVFEGVTRAPEAGEPPTEVPVGDEVLARGRRSTLLVEGGACARIQSGSGFVVAPELVVTNAHVVAGVRSPVVERDDGVQLDARLVGFDPERDLALLDVPGLDREPLPLGDTEADGTGVVLGHPGGGPFRAAPFSVAGEVTAVGRDIYDDARTTRQVLVLASRLIPGDSGAGLLDPGGEVVGVAFAVAPDRDGVAYALTVEELEAFLAEPRTAADAGPCVA